MQTRTTSEPARRRTPVERTPDTRLRELALDLSAEPDELGNTLADLDAAGLIATADLDALLAWLDDLGVAVLHRPTRDPGRLVADIQADVYDIRDADRGRARVTATLLDALGPALGTSVERVHVDAGAHARTGAAGRLGLMAGGEVFLDPSRFAPETRDGRALLAHELVHVAQRENGRRGARPDLVAAEREAEVLAARFAAGHALSRPTAALDAFALAACGPQAMAEKAETADNAATVGHDSGRAEAVDTEAPSEILPIVARRIVLPPIHYRVDRHAITDTEPDARPIMRRLAATLRAYPEITAVAIAGFTSTTGSRAHNLALSERRAEHVAAWLTDQEGIRGVRFEVTGHGEGAPGEHEDEVERAEDRRTEVQILEVDDAPVGAAWQPGAAEKARANRAPRTTPYSAAEMGSDAFLQLVYNAQLARSHHFHVDLPDSELALVDTGRNARRVHRDVAADLQALLDTARADLARAQADLHAPDHGPALDTVSLRVNSGNRPMANERTNWLATFRGHLAAWKEAHPGRSPGPGEVASFVSWLMNNKTVPGFSNHSHGRAVDFHTQLRSVHDELGPKHAHDRYWPRSWFHRWLVANAARFSFRPLATEFWHWDHTSARGASSATTTTTTTTSPAPTPRVREGWTVAAGGARNTRAELVDRHGKEHAAPTPKEQTRGPLAPNRVLRLPLEGLQHVVQRRYQANGQSITTGRALVLIPTGLVCPSTPTALGAIVHLHGNGTDPYRAGRRVDLDLYRIEQQLVGTSGLIAILPLGAAHNVFFPGPDFDPRALAREVFDALHALGRLPEGVTYSGRLTLSAHSGGGLPVGRALGHARRDESVADDVLLFDAVHRGDLGTYKAWIERRLRQDCARLAALDTAGQHAYLTTSLRVLGASSAQSADSQYEERYIVLQDAIDAFFARRETQHVLTQMDAADAARWQANYRVYDRAQRGQHVRRGDHEHALSTHDHFGTAISRLR